MLNETYTGGDSFTMTGLNSGVTYKFMVAANNVWGSSTFTSEFQIITAIVPDPPTAFSGIQTSSSVVLSWTPPVNNGGSAITGYEVHWD
jgi:hypothetical protein